MKLIITTACLVLTTVATGRAQIAVDPPTPPPPVAPAPPHSIHIPLPHEIINESVRRAVQMAQRAVAGTSAAVASALPGAPAGAPGEPANLEVQNVQRNSVTISGSSRPSRTLLIHSTEMDATTSANAEEDLAIMARILDKAARSNPDDGRRFASGIEVDTGAVFGSSSGSRNIILEGYGALFLLSVRYPLIAPPDKQEETKPKDTSSDDWKRAREEIQGSARADLYGDAWHSSRSPVEDFDATKVEQLKTSLLEALKNATHIRALKSDDYITVVVQGADAGRTEVLREPGKSTRGGSKEKATGGATTGSGGGMAGSSYSMNANATSYIRRTTGPGQSVMTLRVKKSDADAYAQDKLSDDEFRKKASIQTYFRKPDASNSANNFMQILR